jgi:hypothetical protein
MDELKINKKSVIERIDIWFSFYFQTDPSQYGFKILNDVPFNTTFRTIGDDIGLFPIAYADR